MRLVKHGNLNQIIVCVAGNCPELSGKTFVRLSSMTLCDFSPFAHSLPGFPQICVVARKNWSLYFEFHTLFVMSSKWQKFATLELTMIYRRLLKIEFHIVSHMSNQLLAFFEQVPDFDLASTLGRQGQSRQFS